MIDAVLCVVILAYCVYACRVDISDAPTIDEGAATSIPDRGGDAVAWTSDTGWTELDERQLIRLLRESAP